jgi:Flp pilus assembly pilin Flp
MLPPQPGYYIREACSLTALRSTLLQGLLQLQWVDNRALEGGFMNTLHRLWNDDAGQDIAEYAVMLAVILVIVVGTIRLIGSNSNNVFSSVSSSLQ